jgi:hypothetical protein
MARITEAHLIPSGTEWLARAASGPEFFVVMDSGDSESEGPSSNPSEEVALLESFAGDFFGANFLDRAVVDVTVGNKSVSDKLPEPFSGERIDFIVVIHLWLPKPGMKFHAATLPRTCLASRRRHRSRLIAAFRLAGLIPLRWATS